MRADPKKRITGRRETRRPGRQKAWSCWLVGPRAGLDLPEGVSDELVVIFFGDIALKDLRGDRDRQVHRFLSNLLDGARRLRLDLPLRVLDHRVGFRTRALAQLLAQPLGVAASFFDNGHCLRLSA